MATGRQTGLQTLVPQPRTVFPGTPARFFARLGWSQWHRSLAAGHVPAYIYYCIVHYSIMVQV